jgi:rare lipoprotein A
LFAQIPTITGEVMKSRSMLASLAATLLAGAAFIPIQTLAADAEAGNVAYYGQKFAGRKTASGERFNPQALTMAHKTLPFGSLVKVTNEKNNRSVVVRVNDRGPTTEGRVGDVSLAAARKLNMVRSGVVSAKLEVVGQAKSRMNAKKAA